MVSISSLDPKYVEKKLQSISNSDESVRSLSTWALDHKAQHEQIVAIWFQVLKTAKIELRLSLFYLCNEIIQTCRKRHAVVFKDAFKEVLKDAALLVRDASVRGRVERTFKIWRERKIYDAPFVEELLVALNKTKAKSSLSSKLLAKFRPENLRIKVSEMVDLEDQVELQRLELPDRIFDEDEMDALKHQMKNRHQGEEDVRKLEEMKLEHSEYVGRLEEENVQRKALIFMLEQSELFYDAQMGECDIVTKAFKNYSTKTNQVRKRLWEFIHPEEREIEEQKKKKRKKLKSAVDDVVGMICDDSGDGARQNGSTSETTTGTNLPTFQPPLPPTPPPPPAELWVSSGRAVPSSVASEMNQQQPGDTHLQQQQLQQYSVSSQLLQTAQQQLQQQNQLQPQRYLQQRQELQQQLQNILEQHLQKSTQHQKTDPHSCSTSIISKPAAATPEDCYEANHYEIGGEESTPVYDEDALLSGDATPVQDEDPSDGYVSSRGRKRSLGNPDAPGKPHAAAGFLGVPLNSGRSSNLMTGQSSFPVGCLLPTPDLSKPPPPFNIFYPPLTPGVPMPGMLSGSNPTEKERPAVEATQGQTPLQNQVVPLPHGMFPLVRVPLPSSIPSPTIPPQFGMIPIPQNNQQQQLTRPPNCTHLLPGIRQPLLPQLSAHPPGLQFQQQIISPPPLTASHQPLQTQQASQHPLTSSHLDSTALSSQDSSDHVGRPSTSLSYSSIPILDRSSSAGEIHYRPSKHPESFDLNRSRVNASGRGPSFFLEADEAGVMRSSKSRAWINQSNLTHVKTMENDGCYNNNNS